MMNINAKNEILKAIDRAKSNKIKDAEISA